MNPAACYRLARQAALRPERFGGLVYRHDTRRLYCLQSRVLVDLVRGLDGTRRLRDALAEFLTVRALPTSASAELLRSLAQLEQLGLLDEL